MDIKQVLGAMTREEQAALICGRGGDTTFPIRALPALKFENEAANNGGVKFPSAVAIACGWDESVAYEIGMLHAKKCCALSHHIATCIPPVLPSDDIYSGERYLYFSPELFLTKALASAYTDGVQSTGVGACVRAEIDGAPLTPKKRKQLKAVFSGDKKCDPKAVFVHGGGNDGNFLRSIGYEGTIVSEWGTVSDRSSSLVGGVDLSLPGDASEKQTLCVDLKNERLISDELLSCSALKVLELIDETYDDHAYGLSETERKTKSMALAAECAVLLKNDAVLPISGNSITVVGKTAHVMPISGEEGEEVGTASLIEALSSDRRVRFVDTDDIDEALEQTQPDETVIVVLADTNADCVGTKRNRYLPEHGLKLIESLQESDRNVIAIVAAGGEVDLMRASVAKGLIYAPYLGSGGAEALKRIICGRVSPNGRLCEDFYAEDKDGIKRVLYPLGYGLSYGEFAYSDIHLGEENGRAAIMLTAVNDGRQAAADTVQVYGENKSGERTLIAFEKIRLKARESREVTVILPPRINFEKVAVGTSKTDIAVKFPLDVAEEATDTEEFPTRAVETKKSVFAVIDSVKDIRHTFAGKLLAKRLYKLALKSVGGNKQRASRLALAAERKPMSALPILTSGAIGRKKIYAAAQAASGKTWSALLIILGWKKV